MTKLNLSGTKSRVNDIVNGAGPYIWVVSDKENIAIVKQLLITIGSAGQKRIRNRNMRDREKKEFGV
jgi:hypothetical protein